MICAFRIPKFGECIQPAVWLIDDGMGTTVPTCNWHVGALLSEETENLVYRVELPMPGVEGGGEYGRPGSEPAVQDLRT
jgi:hypothetical protein